MDDKILENQIKELLEKVKETDTKQVECLNRLNNLIDLYESLFEKKSNQKKNWLQKLFNI
jgi:hypothetical protein